MEKYNIIQRVLERNGYGNTTLLNHMTPMDYIKVKMQPDNYDINIGVETVEITDETVWMRFTHVIDRDAEVDFVTDVYIAPTDKECAVTKGKNLIPVVYNEEYEKDAWRGNYFVYDNKLIAILAVENTEVCCKLCDIPEDDIINDWMLQHKPGKLSRIETRELINICQTIL